MMDNWISADQIFDGQDLLDQHAIRVSNEAVTDVVPLSAISGQVNTHLQGLLTAGFFDIQVNGGGGVLLNNAPTPDGLRQIAAAHRGFGTTAVLPTVISDTPQVLGAVVDAMLANGVGKGVAGLHIEGPHLSLARRGTHAPSTLRPLDGSTIALVRTLREAEIPVLITVAPEAADAADIAALVECGAIVSLGHSAASYDETRAALKAGATAFTHLFNAMPAMENRAPGIVGAALESDAYCGIIADGIHVHPAMVALACRSRPKPDRMIAVSDAMATVGGPDQFDLYGQTIRLRDDRLVNAEGSLAGAHLTLARALKNLVQYGVSLQDALRMCTTNPSRLMARETSLIGTSVEDVVLMDAKLDVQSVGTLPIRSMA